MVQIVRVYTGSDGESHFEDVTPDQFAEIANNVGTGAINVDSFVKTPRQAGARQG